MRSQSAPVSTVAPSFSSSAAIAAIRSVSLTRQLAIFLSVVTPSAKSAVVANVIAASGIALASRSMPYKRPLAGARAVMARSPTSIRAPIRASASAKRTSP